MSINNIIDILRTDSNPEGLFLHPVSNFRQHLCITGGEPLLTTGQQCTIGIYNYYYNIPEKSL